MARRCMTTTRSSRSTTAKKISLRVCRLNLRKKMYFFRKPLATPKQKIDATHRHCYHENAGWSSLVARWAHNPKVGGSNPPPATNAIIELRAIGHLQQLSKTVQ